MEGQGGNAIVGPMVLPDGHKGQEEAQKCPFRAFKSPLARFCAPNDQMSQRLHIGPTEEKHYDCVLFREYEAEQKLLSDWLGAFRYKDRLIFWGPWKITIGDLELYRKIEPKLKSVLGKLGKHYPDDIWMFFIGNKTIEHPEQWQLDSWLA